MTYRPTSLGSQVRLEPDKARALILETFRDAGANLRDAAERLGVTERTLYRYVTALKMARTLGSVRTRARAEGWHKSARWPEAKP